MNRRSLDTVKYRLIIGSGERIQVRRKLINAIAPPTAVETSKIKDIMARGVARAKNLPVRSVDEVWTEFDAAWDAIATEAEHIENN